MPRAKVPPETRVLVEVGSQRPSEVAFDPLGPFEMLWVVTNGKARRKLMWVCSRQTGVYVAFGFAGHAHVSYHIDGTFHTKVAGQKVHHEKRLPLHEIQEPILFQSGTVAIHDEVLARLGLPGFRDRRVDRLIYLDNRGIEAVHYQIWLVPPFRHAEVPLRTDSPGDIHVVTATIPWLEVVIYEQGRSKSRRTVASRSGIHSRRKRTPE